MPNCSAINLDEKNCSFFSNRTMNSASVPRWLQQWSKTGSSNLATKTQKCIHLFLKIWQHHYTSSKRRAFDQGELEESVLSDWLTTGNSNVAAKTVNNCISGTMTASKVPTADWEESTMVISMTVDNWNVQYSPANQKFQWQNWGFSVTTSLKKLSISVPIQLSVVVAITWRHFLQALHSWKPQICFWNFDTICHSSRDTSISTFGGHTATSSCWLLVQLLTHSLSMRW